MQNFAFLMFHGLTKRRIDCIVGKKNNGKLLASPDACGRHKNKPNEFLPEQVENVHKHINSVPRYQSHYSRNNNPNKTYFPIDMKSLYENYITFCTENNLRPVSYNKCAKVFKTDFNIGFEGPKSDKCRTCDKLHINTEQAKISNIEAEQRHLENKRELHLRRAEAGQDDIKIWTNKE